MWILGTELLLLKYQNKNDIIDQGIGNVCVNYWKQNIRWCKNQNLMETRNQPTIFQAVRWTIDNSLQTDSAWELRPNTRIILNNLLIA